MESTAPPDWSDLHWDVLSLIFEKVRPFGVLISAQLVCPKWRRLAMEPRAWRKLVLRRELVDPWVLLTKSDVETLPGVALESSNGGLSEFDASGRNVDDAFLMLVSQRSPELKCLSLRYCVYISTKGCIDACKNLSSLETLEIGGHIADKYNIDNLLEHIGCCCPKLKKFKLSCRDGHKYFVKRNKTAFAIAKNMSQLRQLEVTNDMVDIDGLSAILDGS